MYTFIVNPNARSGLGIVCWHDIEEILKERGAEYEVLFTRYQHHATKLVRDLTSDHKEHTVIALGGDGTVNEVVNGITDPSRFTLGYIPLGSGNDFARALKLPSDHMIAVNNILEPVNLRPLNLGILSYEDSKRRFAVSSGIGFDAAVCHEVVVSPVKKVLNKLKLGKLAYTVIGLLLILGNRQSDLTLTMDDGEPVHFQNAYFATGMNLPYEGGGFKFCPNADPQDDELDVIVAAGMSKLKVLCLLPLAYKGWHVHFKGVYTYRCRKLDLVYNIPHPVHTDGEPILKQSHISMELEKDSITLIGAPH